MKQYNDTLDPTQQVDAEEKIAAQLFEAGLSEGKCQRLSQKILLMVLREFRPDLVG